MRQQEKPVEEGRTACAKTNKFLHLRLQWHSLVFSNFKLLQITLFVSVD